MKIGVLPASEVIVVANEAPVAKFSNKPIYDVIVVGAGLSGLQCASTLHNKFGVIPKNILILEAQDYVGGRVKQVTEFIKGTKIEVGAEFLHGNNTELTKFARAHNEPLREIYCWAHGDGGPLQEPADHGYGLYYIGAANDQGTQSKSVLQPSTRAKGLTSTGVKRLELIDNKPYRDSVEDGELNSKDRLLRYDDKDPDFTALNTCLWELSDLKEEDFPEDMSFYDYLLSKKLNVNMLKMANGGFANTLCSNSKELSMKQVVKWSRLWHAEGAEDEEDGDYTFKNSYSCLVDHLKKDLQIELNTPVQHIQWPDASTVDGITTLTTKGGVEYKTRNVVVTASPHVINNELITFTPPLSEEIRGAFDGTKMNSVTKVIMKFSKPCWPKNLH
eukprot:gene40797-50485_t